MITNINHTYLTQKEAADCLRLSVRTLERHRTAGTGPCFTKLGNRIVYPVDELERWAKEHTFTSTSEAQAALESS